MSSLKELDSVLYGGVTFVVCPNEDVIVGKGHVRAVRLKKTKRVLWVLPGNQITGLRDEAVYAAEEIDRIHREARYG